MASPVFRKAIASNPALFCMGHARSDDRRYGEHSHNQGQTIPDDPPELSVQATPRFLNVAVLAVRPPLPQSPPPRNQHLRAWCIYHVARIMKEECELRAAKLNASSPESAFVPQSRHRATIEISWVPGHMGIEGNDRADALAKEATDLEPARETMHHSSKATPTTTRRDEIRMDHGVGKQTYDRTLRHSRPHTPFPSRIARAHSARSTERH